MNGRAATTWPARPAIWRKMWEIIPDDNFGLNFDPSHLVLQMIDYERVVREFADKIFHVHAKDLHIDREGLYNNGVLSQGYGLANSAPARPGRHGLGKVLRCADLGRL